MGLKSPALTVRDATPRDASAVARLLGTLGYPASAETARRRLEAICSHPDYRTVVAEVDGEVRGLLGLRRGLVYESDDPHVNLLVIVVDEDFQGRGIGTTLIREAEAWARGQGARLISLTSGKHRVNAHRVYEHQGYEANGLRFVKRLEPPL
jgi:GNAT superfamily N-acetyltransferase